MNFTKDDPRVEPKLDEVKPSITQAGAPTITVRKEWFVGAYRITADGELLSIKGFDKQIIFSRELCAAMADALLQAAP